MHVFDSLVGMSCARKLWGTRHMNPNFCHMKRAGQECPKTAANKQLFSHLKLLEAWRLFCYHRDKNKGCSTGMDAFVLELAELESVSVTRESDALGHCLPQRQQEVY